MSKPQVLENSTGTVEGRWTKFDSSRKQHLDRCIVCSELTIPSLLPRPDIKENDTLPTPFQSLGARAVNNLAAKLLLALFPPNTPFSRLDVDPQIIEELKQHLSDKGFKQKVEKQLRRYETIIVKEFEILALRTKMFKALRLLVATGNGLLELLNDDKVKIYRLDKYIVRRSPDGMVKEIIIKEGITPDDIPQAVAQNPSVQNYKSADGTEDKNIHLYTQIIWRDDKYNVHQELLGVTVPDSEATYPKDKLPWLPLCWTLNDGENYGRGHVEENLGDFVAYDSLSESLLDGAAAAAFLVLFLKPNCTTNLNDVKNARNGQWVEGNEDDIGVLRLDKLHDFKFAFEQSKEIEGRISRAFLLNESIQRQAERVTAEEIRYMAQQLEDTLGGIYSILGVDLQRPLTVLLMANLQKKQKLPSLPEDVTITITTGFEALGRGHELQKLREFRDEVVAMGQATQQPDIITMYIGMSNYFTRVANAIGLDTDGLVPDEKEIKILQDQKKVYEQMMNLINTKVAGNISKGMVDQAVDQGGKKDGS